MHRMSNCCLCSIVSGQQRFGAIDKPFLESERFVAVTSIGSFIEGWSLIVPRLHTLSCADYYSDHDFLSFVAETKSHVESIFGNTIMFEHGANIDGSVVGCGVNHAHLHIVPHPKSIENLIVSGSLNWMECSSNQISDLAKKSDYLLYIRSISELNVNGIVATPEKPESQYFRKILGRATGKYEISDYKGFPHLDRSLKSHYLLSAAS